MQLKMIASAFLVLMISGCSLLQQPPREVEIVTKPVQIEIVQPVMPRPLDLKAGEEVVYKKIPNHPHNAVMANITSAAYRKKQKQQTRGSRGGGGKSATDLGIKTPTKVKGGGGSRGADGIIRGLGSDFDELFTRSRFGNTDYRKGGLFRKNK